ncbi:protein-disulfide reductase DsbD [Pontibaca salina]|uniref:Protein-disulfide reductase DsbD n=1 Tax=Pontibaca salina TaxID=2795731 RepID=A0A934LXE5_9RHOB|nr:protein-disulfide reductase DsbD [Pontibaca salina]MBI6628527.1 protein-disulfide reductase DsbD [Pontibaca salina]
MTQSASSPLPPLLRLFLVALFALLWTGAALAQSSWSRPAAPLPVAEALQLDVTESVDGRRLLTWRIAKGYYLYRDYLAAETADGEKLNLDTPPGTVKDDPTFGTVEVYFDSVQAFLPAASGPITITYQGCQDGGICYPPVTETLAALETAAQPAQSLTLAQDQSGLDGLQARGGTLLVFAGFLGFGLLLAFTPCVFPMVPILAGLLASQGETLNARRGAMLSGAYVLAMAAAFGLLGVAAAWSGQNLQMVLQSPAAIWTVAAIFVLLALSMFGLFEIGLPTAWTNRLSSVGAARRGTLAGAWALGFTSALIVGPCVTAPLAGALLYIARTGDLALGAGALFALGLGQGIPLLIAGTFGARYLPRAGGWMDGVKRVFGFVFLGMALWLAGRLLDGPLILALWAALLVAAGIFAGAMDLLPAETGPLRRMLKTGGVLALLAGAIMAFGAALGGTDPLRPLAPLLARGGPETPQDQLTFTEVRDNAALDAALSKASGNPALIYVTADWCVTCRTFDRKIWPDPDVRAALDGMTLIAADLSTFDAAGQKLLDRLDAVGPPTMVFLDRDRRETPGTRIVGDASAARVISAAGTLR